MELPAKADVCVVGANFAGLTAALRLHQAGRSVVVLEARPRVGGRTWTENRVRRLIDRGGAWLERRNRILEALAERFGPRA